jgi:hypothetical protein
MLTRAPRKTPKSASSQDATLTTTKLSKNNPQMPPTPKPGEPNACGLPDRQGMDSHDQRPKPIPHRSGNHSIPPTRHEPQNRPQGATGSCGNHQYTDLLVVVKCPKGKSEKFLQSLPCSALMSNGTPPADRRHRKILIATKQLYRPPRVLQPTGNFRLMTTVSAIRPPLLAPSPLNPSNAEPSTPRTAGWPPQRSRPTSHGRGRRTRSCYHLPPPPHEEPSASLSAAANPL